ncbi:hypothetical protein Tco_1224680 [Tanacetum coccineum]
MFVDFVIQNQFFHYSLKEFAQILDIPCEGACVFTDRWRLDELAYGIPSDGPYQTNLPSIEDIISSILIDQDGQVRRICPEEEIDVIEYQLLTRKIKPTLKPLEEIIRKNIFCLGGNRDHGKNRMENESYVLYDRVMTPLAAQLEQKPRRDRGTRRGRHSTSSSSSAFDQPSLFHLNDDDDDGNDEGTSRAVLTFPNLSDEDITTTHSPTTTSSSLTPPNAPSKTTSTNQTTSSQENTSSSFHLKLQISLPSSHEPNSPPHLNPLLNNISDVPPRPLNPQPLQSHHFLDITLSLSPITPLDHTHNTTSPP